MFTRIANLIFATLALLVTAMSELGCSVERARHRQDLTARLPFARNFGRFDSSLLDYRSCWVVLPQAGCMDMQLDWCGCVRMWQCNGFGDVSMAVRKAGHYPPPG